MDWDPISWAKAALGDAGSIADNVKNWVVGKVREAVNSVESDLEDLGNLLGDAVDGVESVADEAFQGALTAGIWIDNAAKNVWSDIQGDVHAVVGDAISFAERAGGEIEGIAGRVVHDAIAGFGDIVTHAWHEVTDLAKTAEKYADDAVTAFDHDIVAPIAKTLEQLPKELEKYADDAVTAFERDIVDPISRGLTDAEHAIASAADWIAHEGGDAVHLVEEAADWLKLLAAHALHDIEALPEELVQDLSYNSIVSYYQQNAGQLMADAQSVAAGFFGSS